MPTRRTTIDRTQRALDDYHLAEALTLRSALIPTFGFYAPWAPGVYCAGKRDTFGIERIWREREHELLVLWISGWIPTEKWLVYTPGKAGSRPAGWWRYCSREPRQRGETQSQYLTRLGLWLEGERAV